jgi:hypothetical protein
MKELPVEISHTIYGVKLFKSDLDELQRLFDRSGTEFRVETDKFSYDSVAEYAGSDDKRPENVQFSLKSNRISDPHIFIIIYVDRATIFLNHKDDAELFLLFDKVFSFFKERRSNKAIVITAKSIIPFFVNMLIIVLFMLTAEKVFQHYEAEGAKFNAILMTFFLIGIGIALVGFLKVRLESHWQRALRRSSSMTEAA